MEGNASSDQDSTGGGAKKASSPFDNLTREDLIKKCRGLLGIAQKAKQAKDECQEENRKLKEQLSQAETQKTADKDCLKAMQEMVSSLTEQKLQAAMKVDELEKMVAGLRRELDGAALLREQLDKFSMENEAFQRQIKRLTEENEELLNSSFDDASVFEPDTMDLPGQRPSVSPSVELQHTKEKLTKQESRVRHLTALLAEAEQDLAKLTQLNELLKEEVRRHERAIEREKHVHNSEYLKNVIVKFLTLSSGDEKSRLVPVLNTILMLSPEETQKLNSVARGTEGGGRGWTGMLWN